MVEILNAGHVPLGAQGGLLDVALNLAMAISLRMGSKPLVS
jgi:hypothetical protein